MNWPKYPLVEVMWEDAHVQDDWKDMDERIDPYIITTIGYLIREDDKKICVAQEIDSCNRRSNTTYIPCGLVIETRLLTRRGIHGRKRKT